MRRNATKTKHLLGFTRAQVTQGFLFGFLFAGLACGLLAGAVIDRIGVRWVILCGVGLTGMALVLMGSITKLWQYEILCVMEVLGYVLAGPIPNQVVNRCFHARRGRAMGYAYLGLGLGGVVAPLLVNFLIRTTGWRHALEQKPAIFESDPRSLRGRHILLSCARRHQGLRRLDGSGEMQRYTRPGAPVLTA